VVTVQFVRFIAYTTFVVRRHIDAGQSRKHRAAGIREQADPGLPGPGQIIPEGDTMSTVTMQDLELETAELLPARETLWCSKGHSGSTTTTTTVVGSGDGDGNNGISILDGAGDGSLDGDNILVL
jgi:hypothetical protein